MKTFCLTTTIAACMIFCICGCTSKQGDQLTDQQKDQIRKEIIAVGDSIIAKLEKLDTGWLDYYADSPDWGMVNADGSRWDYKYKIFRDSKGAPQSVDFVTNDSGKNK